MVNIIRNSRVFHTALVVWAAFIPLAFFISNNDLFALTGALTFTSALAVLHAYYPAMKQALTHSRDKFDYVDFLTLGIMCSWFAICMRIGYVILLRFFYDVPSEFSSPFLAFLQYVNFTGALLHLSARRVLRNHVPTTSTPRIVIAIVTGLVLGCYLSIIN